VLSGPNHTPGLLKLLIADDSAPFRRLVKTLFPAETTEFVECADGTEAVRVYPEQRPDWVLMDIEMKGLDGISATSWIKARHPEARILIITQYDDPDLRADAQKAGAKAYFLKDNLALIRRYVGENSGPDSSNYHPANPTAPRERTL